MRSRTWTAVERRRRIVWITSPRKSSSPGASAPVDPIVGESRYGKWVVVPLAGQPGESRRAPTRDLWGMPGRREAEVGPWQETQPCLLTAGEEPLDGVAGAVQPQRRGGAIPLLLPRLPLLRRHSLASGMRRPPLLGARGRGDVMHARCTPHARLGEGGAAGAKLRTLVRTCMSDLAAGMGLRV